MGKEKKVSADSNGQDKLLRNKEESKTHVLNTFEEMIMKDGLDKTTITGLSETSGTAESLIYRYYHGKAGLIMALLKTAKYGILSDADLKELLSHHMADNGIELYKLAVNFQFYHMNTNRFLREVHMMKLTDDSKLVSDIIDLKENFREKFLYIGNDHFRNTSIDFPASNAIIHSGLNHNALYAKNTHKPNVGFNMDSSYKRNRLLKAANNMFDLLYAQAKRDKLDN